MVNPQWLLSFVTISRAGTFTRGAEQLGLTQGAVSQHIRQLEDRFGILFVRHARRVEMTPAGHALLTYWQALQEADKRFQLSLAGDDMTQGEVSLITPGSIGLALYPSLLELQRAHPGLAVRCRFAPDGEVIDAVLNNRYELGLVTRRPDDQHLAASLFSAEPLELVVPAASTAQSWDDLQALGFIDHPDGQAMATRLLSRCFPGNPGIQSLPLKGFINQIGLILEPVAMGFGFTVIPQHARKSFDRAEAIKVLDCGQPVIDQLWLIHRAEWPLSGRASAAVAFMRDKLAHAESS